MRNFLGLGVCVFGIFASCTLSPHESGADVTIVRGALVETTDPVYGATVSLNDHNRRPFCTGVLIDSRTVLTAAHCLTNPPAYIGFGSQQIPDRHLLVEVKVSQSIRHEQWDSSDLGSWNIDPWPTSPKNDIGMVVLAEDAPEWMLPAPVKFIGSASIGEEVVLAGYGQTRHPVEPFGQLRRVNVAIDAINDQGLEIMWKALNDGDQSSCHGDSGGPMFFPEQGGSLTLLGVTSRSYSKEKDCHELGIYTDARKFGQWIDTNRTALMRQFAWHHQYFTARDGTQIHLDYQFSSVTSMFRTTTVWLNLVRDDLVGSNTVKARLANRVSGYISQDITLDAVADKPGHFTGEFTQFKNAPVRTSYGNNTNWLEIWIDNQPLIDPTTGKPEFIATFPYSE